MFVQLVDPLNLTADFVANVTRSKKEQKLSAHYVLKRGRPDNELLRLAGEAKTRFAPPPPCINVCRNSFSVAQSAPGSL